MQDAWRAYLDLALGLTETSRKRATKVAKKLVGKGGATAEQLQTMAEDLISTSAANREAITRLVRFELDRTLAKVGLATQEEVTELTTRVRELEEELSTARASASASAAAVPPVPVGTPVASAGPVKAVRKVAKKAVAKKAPAKKAVPGAAEPTAVSVSKTTPRAGARKAGVADTVVKVTPARVVAKKTGSAAAPATPASNAVVKKAVAKKAAIKRTTPSAPGGMTQGEA
ncbi:hypothetical protein GCM10023322_51020 [Rugosimonospora acidiphila]|uniref:Polyhydroxyalkanoate synthesis regulator phasin n=2 Tax=Rugosimonospora acidiphila TaxID=556531 RepID=A0ABP9S8C2_9ACTN